MHETPSPAATLSSALLHLPLAPPSDRSRPLATLTTILSRPSTASLDAALSRTHLPALAVFHARQPSAPPEATRLLDALARRAARAATPDLTASLRAALRADRVAQLRLACAPHISRALAHAIGAEDSRAVPLAAVVRLAEAVEAAGGAKSAAASEVGRRPVYGMGEVDALFFDALDIESEPLHRLWGMGPVQDGYHESVQTRLARKGGLASRVADAVARMPAAAEVVLQEDGFAALRRLVDAPPDEAKGDVERMAFFHAEVARAVGNVAAGVRDVRAAAKGAVDSGLVALLAEWSASRRADGYLQAEAWRALHNLQQAVVAEGESGERVVYENGILPMAEPCEVCGSGVGASDRASRRGYVDVVFVHGIRGSPLLTWRSRSEKNGVRRDSSAEKEKGAGEIWPRDWLARDMRQARVLSIGHEAGVWRDGGAEGGREATLEEQAERVRRGLRAARVGENGRAVVFVTHSYGGLVVKETVQRDERLWAATRGLVFFATPHRGSPVAHRAGVFSMAVREMVMGDPGVERRHEEFVRRIRNRKDVVVASFGESIRLGTGAFLVPKESADAGVGGFEVVQEADHSGVCKVGRRSDGRYRKVVEMVVGAGRGRAREK